MSLARGDKNTPRNFKTVGKRGHVPVVGSIVVVSGFVEGSVEGTEEDNFLTEKVSSLHQ